MSWDLMIPGVNLKRWHGAELQWGYGAIFGEGAIATISSAAGLSMGIDRSVGFSMVKLMLPLLIVVVVALAALPFPPDLLDVRLAMPIGAASHCNRC